jgi:hypothetical protein
MEQGTDHGITPEAANSGRRREGRKEGRKGKEGRKEGRKISTRQYPWTLPVGKRSVNR